MNKFLILLLLLPFVMVIPGCEYWEPVILGTVETQTFTDNRDGKVYKCVPVGAYIWMAENLAYLPTVMPEANGSDTLAFYYVYGYTGTNTDEARLSPNYLTYGVLYNAVAAKTACPEGWRLPAYSEWYNLSETVLGSRELFGNNVWRSGGRFLKSQGSLKNGTGLWDNYSAHSTPDTFRFSGLPAGIRDKTGYCHLIYELTRWWESREEGKKYPRFWEINKGDDLIRNSYGLFPENTFSYGFSIRCVRN